MRAHRGARDGGDFARRVARKGACSLRAVAALGAADRGRGVDCEPLFEWLARMREAAAPIPVACLLIPDEFQVEDALWESLTASGLAPQRERDFPQRWIGARLEREGLPYEDLLAPLRAAPPLADGRRRLYHLRDTHFNARGNEIAARGLAALVRRCLP